jgi:hypothetical protein
MFLYVTQLRWQYYYDQAQGRAAYFRIGKDFTQMPEKRFIWLSTTYTWCSAKLYQSQFRVQSLSPTT